MPAVTTTERFSAMATEHNSGWEIPVASRPTSARLNVTRSGSPVTPIGSTRSKTAAPPRRRPGPTTTRCASSLAATRDCRSRTQRSRRASRSIGDSSSREELGRAASVRSGTPRRSPFAREPGSRPSPRTTTRDHGSGGLVDRGVDQTTLAAAVTPAVDRGRRGRRAFPNDLVHAWPEERVARSW